MAVDLEEKIRHNLHTAVKSAEFYDEIWLHNPVSRKYEGFTLARVEFVDRMLSRYVGRHDLEILDLGCGSGWLSDFLLKWGSVTATDFSPKAIEASREQFGQRIRFILADHTSLRFNIPPDQDFDLVVCSEVIEHVIYQDALLAQIAGFLKPDGWCVLTTPNGNLWSHYKEDARHLHFHQPIENWLTPRACATAVREAGFEILVHEGWSTNYYGYTRMSRLLMKPRLQKNVKRLGLYSLYARLTLPLSMFQLLLIRKI